MKVILTPRQYQIYKLYASGKTQKEIAIALFGKKSSQSYVSQVLKAVGKRCGNPIVTQRYSKQGLKGGGRYEYDINI